ncbi:MAG TPA: hypothetical protein VGI14_01520 [Casimicrobiaceae bacterium]|jgi:hypothetical protein
MHAVASSAHRAYALGLSRVVRLSCLVLLACVLAVWSGALAAQEEAPGDAQAKAAALRARYAELQDRLHDSAFGLALTVDSQQLPERLAGDLYGVINDSFGTLRSTLVDRPQWCQLLLLHINVKDCRTASVERQDGIVLTLGGKNDVGGENGAQLGYRFKVADSTPEYLDVILASNKGPYGTTNHRIALEATALPDGRTFIHLSYAHAYGPVAKLALTAYLNTVGRDKVGFTVVSHTSDGQPVYIQGVRGIVERNCMRYFLAVIAYLRGNSAPPDQRVASRLASWFDLTERWPRQLHEVSRSQYFDTKLQEYRHVAGAASDTQAAR